MPALGCDPALGSAAVSLTCPGCDPVVYAVLGGQVGPFPPAQEWGGGVAGGAGWGGAPARPGHRPRCPRGRRAWPVRYC